MNLLHCRSGLVQAWHMRFGLSAGGFPDGILGYPDETGYTGFIGSSEYRFGAPAPPSPLDARCEAFLRQVHIAYPSTYEVQCRRLGLRPQRIDYGKAACLGLLPAIARLA